MENLDNIKVTVIEKNACTVTASSVMVGLPTLVGPAGPQGPQGPAGPSGQGAWGTISGDISDQTDLQDALDLKADTADLGDMATVDDAPSDGQEYVRKNGDWAVSSGGGGGGGDAVWGSITGTLSNQTDLQSALNAKQNTLTFDTTPTAASTNPVTSGGIKTALDAKANSADLGDLAEKDQAAWSTDISGIPSTFPPSTHNHDDRYYTESEVDTKLSGKQYNYATDATQWDTTPTASSTNPVTSGGIRTALNTKQDSLSWDTAPTSGGTNPMTSGAIYAHEPFQVTGTASAGSSVTFTDSRINSDHWKVPKNGIYFGTPGNVTSGVHWVTNSTSHTITLQATFSGSTTVEIDMNWYQ